ncbi:TadE family protein [Microbacterium koreense]|uniref:TadE family protein n=1 Tax=Microbacterium koreense TaxID=323761 RepID=A0ABW2ZS34_9MICO
MRPSLRDEQGSAALEFIVGGLVLLVPVVYLVVALGMIQQQALGVESGARHVARAISTATDAAEADRRARSVLESITREYGIDASRLALNIDCGQSVGGCPRAGATIVVTIQSEVALPLVPPVLDLDRVAVVPVEGVAVQKMSRVWGGP